jgi:biopolymer transport protein ExbD
MEMNMTPLIDVMLVLLVMFIVTIPIQTHAVKIDLPQCDTCPVVEVDRNKLTITAQGQIRWNGQAITMDGLRYNLAVSQQIRPTPELHLEPAPQTRYAVVDEVLAATKQAGVRNMGFVGNERYAQL